MKIHAIVMLALFLGGTHPALASDFGGDCGYAFAEDPSAQREFLDIGNQFRIRNVRIDPHAQGALVQGEIFNGLQGFFSAPLFKVQLFDADCTYLGANNFGMTNFDYGTTRPFRVIVPNVEPDQVSTYQIQYLP